MVYQKRGRNTTPATAGAQEVLRCREALIVFVGALERISMVGPETAKTLITFMWMLVNLL
jgi:hypothetical protein